MARESKQKGERREHKQPPQLRGYISVRRSGVEMEQYRRSLADGERQTMTDDTMTPDF